jgi:ATP adenylyltransferase
MKKRDVKMAPWRMDYLQKGIDKKDCFICSALIRNPSPENLVLVKTSQCAVMLNRYPYNNGHLMIVPVKHVSRLGMLDNDVLTAIMLWTKETETILQKAYNPDGFNVGINLGAAAGAGLQQHLHVHILPRWSGDTNFMTTVGDTRIIPETPDSAWHRLSALFETVKDQFIS